MNCRTYRFLPLLSALSFVLPSPAAAQQTNVALVHRLLLDQQMVVVDPNNNQRAAQLGQRLNHGDVVATSPNTRAAIRFTDDGSLVRLNPNSQLQVRAEGDRGALAKTLELEFGELWARVTQQQGTFQVQTPAGVAAVRGTEFVVRVGADGATTIITLEGALDFFNDAGSVQVSAGRRASVATASVIAEVQDVQEEEVEQLGELVEDEAADEIIRVEIPIQNAQGVVRTVILEMPRSEARALLNPGGQQ
ncbi:MAG: FecR domain-containing protein [Gemmatimonadetes bacterium]|nr:FecR domain-containing protein [Gemmatimonadota bacterium]